MYDSCHLQLLSSPAQHAGAEPAAGERFPEGSLPVGQDSGVAGFNECALHWPELQPQKDRHERVEPPPSIVDAGDISLGQSPYRRA